MLMNGVDEDCPDICLSIFSFVSILLAVSTVCVRSSMGIISNIILWDVCFKIPLKFVALHNLK